MTQTITDHADNGDDANVKGSHRPDSCGQTRDRQIQPTISKFSSPSPFDDCDDNGGFVLWVILIQFLFHIALIFFLSVGLNIFREIQYAHDGTHF